MVIVGSLVWNMDSLLVVGDRKLGKDLFLNYIWNLGVSGSYNKTIRQFYKQDDIIYWFENGYLA